MKIRIRINKNTQLAWIPKGILKEGFVGDVEAFADALTLVLIKPGTPLAQVRNSLRLLVKDIDLRLAQEQEPRVGDDGDREG